MAGFELAAIEHQVRDEVIEFHGNVLAESTVPRAAPPSLDSCDLERVTLTFVCRGDQGYSLEGRAALLLGGRDAQLGLERLVVVVRQPANAGKALRVLLPHRPTMQERTQYDGAHVHHRPPPHADPWSRHPLAVLPLPPERRQLA